MWEVIVDTVVSEFIDHLEFSSQPKTLHVLKLLGEYGPLLREPHSKKISSYPNLFELRTSGSSPIRMFYTIHDQKFHVLHGFIKKTDKTPLKELKLALKRKQALTI